MPLALDALALVLLADKEKETVESAVKFTGDFLKHAGVSVDPEELIWETLPSVVHYDPNAAAWVVTTTRPTAPDLTGEDLVAAAPVEDWSIVTPELAPPPPAEVKRAHAALRAASGSIVPGAEEALATAMAFTEQASEAVHGPAGPVVEPPVVEQAAVPLPEDPEIVRELEDHYGTVKHLEEFTGWAQSARPFIGPHGMPPPGDPSIDAGDPLSSAVARAKAIARYAVERDRAMPDHPPPPPPGQDVRSAIREYFRKHSDVLSPQAEVWLIGALEAADAGWPAVPAPPLPGRALPVLPPEPLAAARAPGVPPPAFAATGAAPLPAPAARPLPGVDTEPPGVAAEVPSDLPAPRPERALPVPPAEGLPAPGGLGVPPPALVATGAAPLPDLRTATREYLSALGVDDGTVESVAAKVPSTLPVPVPPTRALPEPAEERLPAPKAEIVPPWVAYPALKIPVPAGPNSRAAAARYLESLGVDQDQVDEVVAAIAESEIMPPVPSRELPPAPAEPPLAAPSALGVPPPAFPAAGTAAIAPDSRAAAAEYLAALGVGADVTDEIGAPAGEPLPIEVAPVLRAPPHVPPAPLFTPQWGAVPAPGLDERIAFVMDQLLAADVADPLMPLMGWASEVAAAVDDEVTAPMPERTLFLRRPRPKRELPAIPTERHAMPAARITTPPPVHVPELPKEFIIPLWAWVWDASDAFYPETDEQVVAEPVTEQEPKVDRAAEPVPLPPSRRRADNVERWRRMYESRDLPPPPDMEYLNSLGELLRTDPLLPAGTEPEVSNILELAHDASEAISAVELPELPPIRKPTLPDLRLAERFIDTAEQQLAISAASAKLLRDSVKYARLDDVPIPPVPSLVRAAAGAAMRNQAMVMGAQGEAVLQGLDFAADVAGEYWDEKAAVVDGEVLVDQVEPEAKPREHMTWTEVVSVLSETRTAMGDQAAETVAGAAADVRAAGGRAARMQATVAAAPGGAVTATLEAAAERRAERRAERAASEIEEAFKPVPRVLTPHETALMEERDQLRGQFDRTAAEYERLRRRTAQRWRRRRVREADAERATELGRSMAGYLERLNEVEGELTDLRTPGFTSDMLTVAMPQGDEAVKWLESVAGEVEQKLSLSALTEELSGQAGFDQRNQNLHPRVFAEGCFMMDLVWMGMTIGQAVGNENVAKVVDAGDMNDLYKLFLKNDWVGEDTTVKLHPKLLLYAAGSIDENGDPIEGATAAIDDALDKVIWWDEPVALAEYNKPLDGYVYTWHHRAPGKQHWTCSVLDQRYDPLHGSSTSVNTGKVVGYRRFKLSIEAQRALEAIR